MANDLTSPAERPRASLAARVAGWLVALPPMGLLLMGGVMKVLRGPDVVEGFKSFGYAESVIVPIGVIELACAILYLIPQTAVLGAILLTGYLGGACATHLAHQDPLLNVLTPVVFGVLLWVGLYLRDPRLRELAPLRSIGS
jgi:hypothetical protein